MITVTVAASMSRSGPAAGPGNLPVNDSETGRDCQSHWQYPDSDSVPPPPLYQPAADGLLVLFINIMIFLIY